MEYKASIVELPGILLSVCQAESFPEGIQETWTMLEALVGDLKGRKFYGITIPQEGQLVYYAGVEPRDEAEIASLGLPTYEIQGGRFARQKLSNWTEHVEEIPQIFDYLIKNFPMQENGPTIEFYRSQTELHLLIPLV